MADLSPIWVPSRVVENAPLEAGLSQLLSQFRGTATSLKAWFLPPSSSIRWVIPCSHVRVFARRLGR
jgi:hypothetical protein